MNTKTDTPLFLEWARARLDEMDAMVIVLRDEAEKLQGVARVTAHATVTEMLKQRDGFSDALKKQRSMAEDTWATTKDVLEAHWSAFDIAMRKYFAEASELRGQQVGVFRAAAEAQRKAWQRAVAGLRDNMTSLTSEQKARAEATMKAMNEKAEAAKATLDALGQAGNESWSAYKAALATTREAFDRAIQSAQQATRRAP